MKRAIRIAAGVLLAALGVLWALQGADLIRIDPILCFANCEPLTGGSITWLVVGLVCLAIGVYLLMPRNRSQK